MIRKNLSFILFCFLFIFLNLSLVIACNNTKDTVNNYFRIHVVANSDNIDDQMAKLKVAKNVETYISELTQNITDKETYIYCIAQNIQNILQICQNTLIENNSNHNVCAYIGTQKYSEKAKNNIKMSEGLYNSLKIVIGNGNGENWWSLLFPHSIQGFELDETIDKDLTFSSGIFDFFNNIINNIHLDTKNSTNEI